MNLSSTPTLTQFDPTRIPYQIQVINDVRENFDYSMGVHEILLSGSVGSAKSILGAHLGITHCLKFEKSRGCLARQSMPDLKETILSKVLEHMEGDLVEGEDYEFNQTKAKITFANGSEIISRSWADGRFKKFRSVELSWALVEELTENTEDQKDFYTELKMRVGRLPHVPENWICSMTNPDGPDHWGYKYFITSDSPTRHVYYSVTTDNPFLPAWYIEQLKKDLDPKMARRMIYGEWIEISGEVVYHTYSRDSNFKNSSYTPTTREPIRLSFDFNIGEGKPMSACAGQYLSDRDEWHWFRDFVVQGARTEDICNEIADSGTLDIPGARFIVHGDASGKNRDTRNKRSDYDIIEKFLSEYITKDRRQIVFEMEVPPSNPPVRKRHNTLNGYMRNSIGQTRLFVYQDAKTLDEGFRLTKLKRGGNYIEDDSKHYQHVTTAAGYAMMARETFAEAGKQRTTIL